MQAAQILAGYSLGEADLLRRAMGKKIMKEMRAQRAIFVEGAIKNGIEKYQADAIFDLLERFAEYGFNKSHAAGYALVAYQTAYMKANYPGRVPGRLDDARHGQYRQARRIPRRGGAARHQGRPALDQPVACGVRGRRQHHHLRAGRAQRRRPAGGRSDRRARDRPANSPISPTSPTASIRAPSTSACWRAWPPPAPSTNSSKTARACSRPWTRCWRAPSARTTRRASGRTNCSAAAARASRSRCPMSSRGCRPSA